MDKKVLFNAFMTDVQIANSEFSRAKVNICYAGRNRNFTDIPKETLDKMVPSIYGIPVVGEFKKDENAFGGHGGKIEITDEGMEFVDTTRPFGFVDPCSPVFYETIKEKDGITENEYLSCYVYLWHGRYPELNTVLDNGAMQSMEINVANGEMDNDGYYVIKDATFSALCILGVEPCFESSTISTRFSKAEMHEEYETMIKAFKKYTLDNLTENGGVEMEDNKQFTEEVIEETVESEQPIETFEEVVESATEETNVEVTAEEVTENFEEVAEEVTEETAEVVEEVTEEVPVVEVEETPAEDFEVIKQEYEATIANLTAEVEELRKFKADRLAEIRKESEEKLFEQYACLNDVEEFENIKADTSKFETLEDLEKEIALIFARTQMKKTANKKFAKEDNQIKILMVDDHKAQDEPYGGLFNKYL